MRKGDYTVREARKIAQEHMLPGAEAMECWVCDRRVHGDPRTITGAMCGSLKRLYWWHQKHGRKWYDYRTQKTRGESRNHSLMRWRDEDCWERFRTGDPANGWGLIEPRLGRHLAMVSPHSRGWWRITERGIAFVEGRIAVPWHVFTYNQMPVAFDRAKWITYEKARKQQFDVDELLNEPVQSPR